MSQKKQLRRVLIMAGGTGGHVFPGLAVAKHLRDHHVEVHWLGTSTGLEARLVPDAHIPLHIITISGLRGKGIKPLLTMPIKMARAIKESVKIIRKIDPDVIIGLGGFVSGPGGIASWLTRRPLVIHEQNAKAGLTNKVLAYFAERVLVGFPTAFKPQSKVIMTGNPIRSEMVYFPAPHNKHIHPNTPFHLLVLGGSLGAQALNDSVPQALAALDAADRPVVLHQTGDKHLERTKNIYESKGIKADLKPFIHGMAQAYEWADMVLCRAGALTVAELCAVGRGAIFIPFPHAVDDHQTANARFMVNNKAALCIQQAALTTDRLAEVIRQYARSPEKCFAMAQAAYQLRNVDAVEKIFKICQEVCR